jgi:hypothetical protein
MLLLLAHENFLYATRTIIKGCISHDSETILSAMGIVRLSRIPRYREIDIITHNPLETSLHFSICSSYPGTVIVSVGRI